MKDKVKIWGIFNTYDESLIDQLSEFDLWCKIYFLNKEINCMLRYASKPNNKDLNIKALIEEQFNLEYLTYYTRKFGVEFDKTPSYGEHIKASESFNSWYEFWLNHYKSMNSIKYKDFIKDKNLGNDISKYLPKNSWKDTRKNKSEDAKLIKAYQ